MPNAIILPEPSQDNTHFVLNGKAVFQRTFLSALPFHAEVDLAAVQAYFKLFILTNYSKNITIFPTFY
ncbi:MAG: hypothetical protein NZ551_10510 [Microscillaceae bacterium]|nr:hypothetical protein [Microscillaceae bacterium]MDW8461630.1 hypothetical protein [Cytophagales bacterium]